MVSDQDYFAYFTQMEEKMSAAREDMKRRLLSDPIAHAVNHIVRVTQETAAEPNVALLNATVAIMEIFDGQKP